MELMTWSDANPKDIVNAPFLRLDKDVEGWPRDQVKLTKTIAFDGLDPRVDLANGSSIFSVTTISDNHAPVISVDEVGYLFARIMLSPRLPAENVVVTLHCTIGSRTDTIVITTDNQANALWEVYSDKYFDETSVSYTVDVEITGASFTDEVISYSSPEVVIVPIPEGRIKCLNPLKVALPPAPADKVELINAYINAMPG
jgi:hypothetical protein